MNITFDRLNNAHERCDVARCPNDVTYVASWAHTHKKVCTTHQKELDDKPWSEARVLFQYDQPVQGIDAKVVALKDYFQKKTGCQMFDDWKIDLRCFRFYFQNESGQDWQYILDVSQSDLEKQDIAEVKKALEAAKWHEVLRQYLGKCVAVFSDNKFANPGAFRAWPKKTAYTR